MGRLAAFLQGINLGSRRVKMATLRGHFEAMGLEGVESFGASGNLVFDEPPGPAPDLETRLEAHLEASLGFRTATLVRPMARVGELTGLEVVARGEEEGFTPYVTFLRSEPGAEVEEALSALETGDDRFETDGREVIWLRRGRLTDSEVETRDLERAFGGMDATRRKITTLRRMAGAALALVGLLVTGACDFGPQPAPIDVVEVTIPEVQGALAADSTTCRMVVQAHLDRIEAYEARLNAVTVVNPRALAVADSLDASRAAGEPMGPLHCIPMLVKDNFDTHDMMTTGGSVALMGSIPPDDAFMVRKVREAGAVVVAKTNMAEWAFSPRQTISSSFDTTRNAYAPDRTPAGSSGGTASGVAASFGVIGLGSDTGNSIRGPSAHLALVGIRSTIGITSRDGVIPLAFDRDIAGPMGRTVADVARVFDVVAGYDPADPYTEPAREHVEEDYTAFLDAGPLDGTRLAVVADFVDPAEADSAVLRVFDAAVADLERLGAEVVDSFPFDLQAQLDRRGMFCSRFRYDMGRYLESLDDPPITDVIQVLETGEYSDHAESGLRSFASGPLDVHPADMDPPCPDFTDHPGRQAFLEALVAAMDGAEIDALIYPSWSHPPAPLDRAREEYRGDNSQVIAPATGTPAITVPMGYTHGGLPAGLQILGRPYDEGLLFRLAYAYEQATGHRRPPEGFPELARTPDGGG